MCEGEGMNGDNVGRQPLKRGGVACGRSPKPDGRHLHRAESREVELGCEVLYVLLQRSYVLGEFLTLELLLVLNKLLRLASALDLEGELSSAIKETGDDDEIGLLESTSGESRSSNTDTSRGDGRLVAENGVLVKGDRNLVADGLHLRTGDLVRAEVPEDKVVVCTIGNHLVSPLHELRSKGLGVLDDLLRVLLEHGSSNLFELDGNGSHGVVVRSTLKTREDGEVDPGLQFELLIKAVEDHGSTRTTERLVSGSSDNMRVLERVVQELGSHKAGGVGHIGHEKSTNAVSNLTELLVVPITRVGRGAADDHLGEEDPGLSLELFVVDETGLTVDAVGHGLEEDGRGRDLLFRGVESVGQVSAGRQVETESKIKCELMPITQRCLRYPIIRSWGLRSAVYTAKLAGDPE